MKLVGYIRRNGEWHMWWTCAPKELTQGLTNGLHNTPTDWVPTTPDPDTLRKLAVLKLVPTTPDNGALQTTYVPGIGEVWHSEVEEWQVDQGWVYEVEVEE